jgi:para-aminobenzoate synthetase component 1
VVAGGADPLGALRERLAARRIDWPEAPVPFPFGAVGYVAYDYGRRLEALPARAADDLGIPDCHFAFYDAVAAFDHASGAAFVCARPGAGAAARRLCDRIRGAARAGGRLPRLLATLRSTFSRDEYVEAVLRVKDWMEAGDVFQVNLSQRFLTETDDSGLEIYRRLARANPAPYAAYLSGPDGLEIVSASPERFLLVEGDRVETTPVKGTRPRGANPADDAALARDLLSSAKDRAELVMIVDLMRNDLGRVARFGSVEVPELGALTSHATVHHLHGTVTARLAPGRDGIDLLTACFPGGSITGAPKVRAMEIIEELEPVRRGVYTGAIGYFSDTGRSETSIAIRTLVVRDGRASFSVGGGIVADSDPVAEYEETLAKGRGLAAALGYRL